MSSFEEARCEPWGKKSMQARERAAKLKCQQASRALVPGEGVGEEKDW